jgi:hypothetical protein
VFLLRFFLIEILVGNFIYFYWKVSVFSVKFLQNTPGLGAEYEILVPAYFALKLNNAEDIQNYWIESNVDNFGKFDDVVINVLTRNNQQIRVAIQLKHKDSNNKTIYPDTLESPKGDFSLQKYCKSLKEISNESTKQHQLILYTNANINFQNIGETTKFTMIEDPCAGNDIAMLMNTSERKRNVYRFRVNHITLNDEENNITKSDYEDFFSRFRIFFCQKNVEDLKEEMINFLEMNAVLQYIELFRNWHQGKFTNKKIDKATVNVHLVDIFLPPFIITGRYFPVGQNGKLKLFEKVIKEFDVTLVNDSFEHFKQNLTDNFNPEEGIEEKLKSYKERYKIEPNESADVCIMRLAKEIKIIGRSVTKLENEVKLKVLQYAFGKPIMVKFNETSRSLIHRLGLCRLGLGLRPLGLELCPLGLDQIKFILVGQGIQSDQLSSCRFFLNLNDLRKNIELYREITRTCRLSLQGRKETTLEELINSCQEISEHVGVKEIFEMLDGKLLIGQAIESLPSFYVNRKISFKVEKIDTFLDGTFFEKHLAVVKFDKNVKNIQNEISKCNITVVDVHDYLQSTQVSNERTIISTNEEHSKQLVHDVYEKSDNKSVVYLKISEHNRSLIISIQENQFHSLTRPLNILYAVPGMGKTTMLKKLRKECGSMFWTVDVDLKTHYDLFKTKHDVNQLLNHLVEGNENSFPKYIRDVFWSKKKVYFFFDGLDEVEKSCVENILASVQELSSEGFQVWISSRKNPKSGLENRFDTVAMDMEEIEEEQQKFYIKNRLKEEYDDEQIENLIRKIFNSSDIDNNCQVLGKVLQLYIITQMFLDDKELHEKMPENIFFFTQMYDLFFHGRFEHNQNSEESGGLCRSVVKVEEMLQIYEHLAVNFVFGEEVYKKLKVQKKKGRSLFNNFTEDDDILGIVKMKNTGKAVFEHFTYGEYFAARFFRKYKEKVSLISEELLSNERKNFRIMLNALLAEDNPLDLDVDQIEKYIVPSCADPSATTLHVAAQRGDLEMAALLIEKGAIVNALTSDKSTPLHLAASKGYSKIVKLLIKKGASVNALTSSNLSPLNCAEQSGNAETVALLIENEASVNALTTANQALLHWALQFGTTETIAFLDEECSIC